MASTVPGISPECLEGHNGEQGACRGCGCACHTGKVPIPPDVVAAARAAGASSRRTFHAQAARDARTTPNP